MDYVAPLKDMLFVIRELAGIASLRAMLPYADATDDTVEAVLNEAARFNREVVAPLNRRGDEQPARWHDGEVTTTPGFRDAFAAFARGGWQGVQHPPQFGGQGLPKLVSTACAEMLNSANLSFALCPLLTDGAIEALLTAGTPEQQQRFIPPMISGRWTGTMNLTEPQAGSDLSLVRTRAEPQPDGSYRLFGQKIFITYGEHDLAENIVHLVLARTPGAPDGVKGLSLFIVPKVVADAAGSPGKRNDVWCASIEHKLGIKASPTAVLLYGDGKGEVGRGAIGHLIGQENRGLEYMFIMMNAARFAVGMQGVSIAERAYQQAVAHARERVQSRAVEGSSGPVPIIRHPDVRRMLMQMRACTEAARALGYVAAAAYDTAHGSPDRDAAAAQRALYEFLVPIVKGFSTEISIEVASLGVQVHGGMGYIEETGAAQHYRDARILTIYEGTTAIQANDLIGRKTIRDGGRVARAVVARVRETERELAAHGGELAAIGAQLAAGADALDDAIGFVVERGNSDPRAVYAGSVPYLMLAGTVLAGWQMGRAALAAARRLRDGDDPDFARAKIASARFYADHVLSRAHGLRCSVVDGAAGVLALEESQF
ncbi:MAG TPA: acyl-CoA dehydrogenase [Burkholderiaceae bacterium]|nr:acyl-CoA dehydrogenase [Burkholderiaceae bacterium]